MTDYTDLCFLEEVDMPRADTQNGRTVRSAIKRAINNSRVYPGAMQEVLTQLKFALAHIEAPAPKPASPPAKAKPKARRPSRNS